MSNSRNVIEELRNELISIDKTDKDILKIYIHLHKGYTDDYKSSYVVFEKYEDIPTDLIYSAGYGGQELYGFILFKDGTWLERGEYDGSEWWEYKSFNNLDKLILELKQDLSDEVEFGNAVVK